MDPLTALLLGAVIVLTFSLVLVALYRKGDLKVGAKVGSGSFFMEVHEKENRSRDLPS